jgi:hypothetical protein
MNLKREKKNKRGPEDMGKMGCGRKRGREGGRKGQAFGVGDRRKSTIYKP